MEGATATPHAVTILIAGLGGQGVVLAGDVLAGAALLSNMNVKKSESHGLSRRFGSVSCQVRFGRELHSPLRGHGGVDLLLAFEGYEALKNLPFVNPSGTALVNRLWRKPAAHQAKSENSPSLPSSLSPRLPTTRLPTTAAKMTEAGVASATDDASSEVSDSRIAWFDGSDLTHQAECPRSLNFFMLGVLSARLTIPEVSWHESLDSATDRPSRDANREMFAAGRRIGLVNTTRDAATA